MHIVWNALHLKPDGALQGTSGLAFPSKPARKRWCSNYVTQEMVLLTGCKHVLQNLRIDIYIYNSLTLSFLVFRAILILYYCNLGMD